jgi:biotin--protein ligase
MSLLLRTPLSVLPAQKLVFVQYLAGLAVAEACRDDVALGEWGECVRLKWPNDLYAMMRDSTEKKKVGGILVNTSVSAGKVEIVIGIQRLCTPSRLDSF